MAAPVANDRKLAAEVRRMTLNKIQRLFSMATNEMTERELQLHDEVFKRLAGTVLPRLTEVSGEDGGVLRISFDPAFKQNDPTPETEGNSTEQSQV